MNNQDYYNFGIEFAKEAQTLLLHGFTWEQIRDKMSAPPPERAVSLTPLGIYTLTRPRVSGATL
jgi:hypothetical protein